MREEILKLYKDISKKKLTFVRTRTQNIADFACLWCIQIRHTSLSRICEKLAIVVKFLDLTYGPCFTFSEIVDRN
jgi:hypothetical protein